MAPASTPVAFLISSPNIHLLALSTPTTLAMCCPSNTPGGPHIRTWCPLFSLPETLFPWYPQPTSSSPGLDFYCCREQLLQTQWLETTPIWFLSSVGQMSRHSMVQLVHSSEHEAKIKVSARLHCFLEALGLNLLPSSFGLLAEFSFLQLQEWSPFPFWLSLGGWSWLCKAALLLLEHFPRLHPALVGWASPTFWTLQLQPHLSDSNHYSIFKGTLIRLGHMDNPGSPPQSKACTFNSSWKVPFATELNMFTLLSAFP